MSLFLNKDELAILTGKVRYGAQIKALSDMRVPFVLNAANRPVVARAAVERILGVESNLTVKQSDKTRWKSAKTT